MKPIVEGQGFDFGSSVLVSAEMHLTMSKKAFLANPSNKQALINLLAEGMVKSGITVEHAGEDSDVFQLLTHYADVTDRSKNLYMMTSKQIVCITTLKRNLVPALPEALHFLHAVSGCDTTSRPYGIGKAAVLTKYAALTMPTAVFMSPSSTKEDIEEAGEEALLVIYGCTTSPNLSSARVAKFQLKVATSQGMCLQRNFHQRTMQLPSIATGHIIRAICFKRGKEYSKALQDYGVVMLIGDQLMLKVLINRGLLYFEKSDFTNALYDFKMAAKLNPEDHRILHTLGLCYHKMGHLRESVRVFTTCVKNNPYFLDGIIARGNVYMDFGTDEGIIYARRDYERVIIKDPLCMPARVNLAYTLQVSGKFMQAWTQFTNAIQLKPTYKPALEGRAIVNLQMSNTFAAYQDIHASIKVASTAELLTNRGVVNQFMLDRVNAMKDYQAAIKLDPSYSLAYFNAANVYFHTRHFRQALDYYGKAIEFNARDESAFLNRAITKVMLRDAEGALKDFRAAIQLSPYSAHMYFNRGNLYMSMHQFEKAERDYTKALELKPDDPFLLKRRADVRGKLEKREAAIEDYRLAIKIQSHLQGE
ncbi:hypothetical protein ScPMuIL_009938 [Solemya velum]